MEFFNNTLAIEANWLVDEGVMTTDQYDHAVKRKQVNVVRRGCRNTPALVAYDSMPERFKQAVRERVGPGEAHHLLAELVALIRREWIEAPVLLAHDPCPEHVCDGEVAVGLGEELGAM